ncbi:hypothetical protein [Aeromicrobium massiliense]|uniref:hypothetical protein n=1 Tax=Aeromicrobium massiliense TaxID=1464554 RepID=UPI0002D7D1D9|nr:hypothetical protein [Aeromicrobium massiliense]
MRKVSSVATAGLAGVLVLGATAVADADQSTIRDKRADVLVGSVYDEDGDDFRRMNAIESRASGIDITSGRFKHGKKTISVTLRFARLKSNTIVLTEFYVPGRKKAAFTLRATTEHARATVVRGSTGREACTAKLRARRGENGSVTATIRRSCLGSPSKLRMATTAVRFSYRGGELLSAGDPLSGKKVQSAQKTPFLRSN